MLDRGTLQRGVQILGRACNGPSIFADRFSDGQPLLLRKPVFNRLTGQRCCRTLRTGRLLFQTVVALRGERYVEILHCSGSQGAQLARHYIDEETGPSLIAPAYARKDHNAREQSHALARVS
jgi:hypothetical protein